MKDRSYLKQQSEFIYTEIYDWNVYCISKENIQGKNILDAGGHFGMFTILMHDYGAKQIVTLEPNPINFNILLKNTLDMSNVTCINAACTNNTGEFQKIDLNGYNSRLGRDGVVVTTISLADALNLFPANEQVCLKMDIEGTEHLIISNANKSLFDRVSDIFIEIHNEVVSGPGNTIEKLKGYILSLGYNLVWEGKYYNKTPETVEYNRDVSVLNFKKV